MSNRIELEKSYILTNEAEIKVKKKIEQEQYKKIGEDIEEDTYFSDKDLEFVKNRICLRTRKTNDEKLELTYKPKSTEETEKYGKKEVNIELQPKDHEDIKFIIKQLGYIEYISFKKYRTTYSKIVNGIERNIMIDELKGIGKFIELEILSDTENKEKMVRELDEFINEFECKNLESKKLPYRDIAKKYQNVELLDVVDENNELTGRVEDRKVVDKESLWHRIATTWIMNKKGEILLQKRAATKAKNPNIWGKTGGHVDSGETPEEAIIREVKEELGIVLDKDNIEELDIYKSKEPKNKYFGYNYFSVVDYKVEDCKLQIEEVDEVKYVSIEEMEQSKNNPNYVFYNWDNESFYEQMNMLKEKRSKIINGR